MSNENEIRALAAPASAACLRAVPEQVTVYPSYSCAEPEEPAVPLSHYRWVLKRHRWKILAFVLTSVIATAVVSSRLTPVYEAVATLDVDRQAPAGVIGQDANRAAPNDADQFLATQVTLVQSDSVLRPVVQRFHLPVAGAAAPDPQLPTARAANAPITLAGLKVARPPNTYLLLISYRSADPELAADVSNAVAQSYIEHLYDIRFRAAAGLSAFMEKPLEELRAKREHSALALARFEKELDVVNPEEKTGILSSRLLQLNTDYTSAQADRMAKQAAFNAVQSGALEALQASSQGEQLRRLADRLNEAQESLAVVATTYGVNYPLYKKADSQVTELRRQLEALKANIAGRVAVEFQQASSREAMLKNAVAETKVEFDRLNAHSFQYKALKQEADGDRGLYDELLRKIKEAGINSSFQNSSIRLADAARTALQPVFPNTRLNAVLALLFSTLLACCAAVLSDVLDATMRDPEHIRKVLGADVLGSLPMVKSWRGRIAVAQPFPAVNGNGGNARTHRSSGQIDAFEEAIRSLRDSILLSGLARHPRSLLITSATPREGKTTSAVHLAVAHSLQGRKTLLIDADLRRPGVHFRMGLGNARGLATVINEGTPWREALQKPAGLPDLDVLTAGEVSLRAADRLGIVLKQLLEEAAAGYDLVVIDAPPLLGFAEPLQMAAIVDGVVVITLAGQTNQNAVTSVLTSLKRVKATVVGVALNEVRADMSDRYYYYGCYGKDYSKCYKTAKA
ncbi:MAG: polysaccharide biosynthesis tyrosine autokinase [Acidobacteriia bacterium]|nr:polysaccharide biosynthesis tyrosine autokinase [Terriglobia bacterium]